MGAPKGNTYYLDNKNFFKPKKYSVNQLKKKFIEYVEHNKTHTMSKVESIKSGDKAGETFDVKLKVPLTIKGFTSFIGITHQTFLNYESEDSYKAYFEVIKLIREFIENEQLQGASLGLYNSNIIARLQGLKEQTDVTSGGNEIKSQVVEFQLPSNGRNKDSEKDE